MLAEHILTASLIHSPIGPIPRDYPKFTKLCIVASIRHRDETIKREGIEIKCRRWFVVADDKPATDGKGNVRGAGSTKFHKFCMLLDLIEDQNPGWSRSMILDEATDQTAPSYRRLMAMNWRQMNDELARMGIRNYMILKSRKTSDVRDLADF